MENEKFIIGKIKEFISDEIFYLMGQENEYYEAAKTDYRKGIRAMSKQEVRSELQCLQSYIAGLEASSEVR